MMRSSDLRRGSGRVMAYDNEIRDLTPTGLTDDGRLINLRDLGFVGYVTEPALARIERNEARANLVVTTAVKFAFR